MLRYLFTVALLTAPALGGTIPIQPSDFLPGASVITFETGSTALPIVPGVTFLDTFPPTPAGWFASDGAFVDGFFGSQVMANLTSSSQSDMGIVFATPVPAVGAWMGKIDNFLNMSPPDVNFRVFDAAGNQLAASIVTLPYPERGDAPAFAGYLSDAGIKRVEWIGGNRGFFGVDNITYGAAVPEPASALLVVTLGCLAATRRRDGAA